MVVIVFENETLSSQIVKHQVGFEAIDLLAILQKILDRELSLYIFIHEVRLSSIRASISIVHIRKFYKTL